MLESRVYWRETDVLKMGYFWVMKLPKVCETKYRPMLSSIKLSVIHSLSARIFGESECSFRVQLLKTESRFCFYNRKFCNAKTFLGTPCSPFLTWHNRGVQFHCALCANEGITACPLFGVRHWTHLTDASLRTCRLSIFAKLASNLKLDPFTVVLKLKCEQLYFCS